MSLDLDWRIKLMIQTEPMKPTEVIARICTTPSEDDVRASLDRLQRSETIVFGGDQYLRLGPALAYDKTYGDDQLCACGHPYYRHFDTYADMDPVGCKYCECRTFRRI